MELETGVDSENRKGRKRSGTCLAANIYKQTYVV